MSLRTFHIIFIICSILTLFGFGGWAMVQFSQVKVMSYLLTALGSTMAGMGLIVYEVFFIRKVKG